jgi:hypothetical protein
VFVRSGRERERATLGERAGRSPHIPGRTRQVERFLEIRPGLCAISARFRKLARNQEWLNEDAGSPVMARLLDGRSHPFRDGIELRSPGAKGSMA